MVVHERKKVINTIQDLSFEIKEHIIRLILLDSEENIYHWVGEIITYLSKINKMKLKPKGKKLSPNMYFKLLYEEPFEPLNFDEEKKLLKTSLKYHDVNQKEINYEVNEKLLKGIFKQISYNISNNMFNEIECKKILLSLT